MTDVVIQIALRRHHVAHRAGFEGRQPIRVERFDALNDLIFGHSGEDQFRSLESERQDRSHRGWIKADWAAHLRIPELGKVKRRHP